jgi:uncharacterized protein involved in response to NO
MGVGGKLIPGIFGHAPIIVLQRSAGTTSKPILKNIPTQLFVLGALFIVSFVMEIFANRTIGTGLRAIVVTFVALAYWKTLKLPQERGVMTIMLWLSAWSIVLGVWGYVLSPVYAVHAAHLIFVSGFSLMTLMVASRVTLAHNQNQETKERLEKKSKILLWVGILVILAALTRVTAPFIDPLTYFRHLMYAAILWAVALLMWMILLVPRMWKPER